MEAPFETGERVLLLDARGRRYLVRLQDGGTFHFHGGPARHGDLLGKQEGVVVTSGTGASLAAYRPRLADFILKMPRGAQVLDRIADAVSFRPLVPARLPSGYDVASAQLDASGGDAGFTVFYQQRSSDLAGATLRIHEE